MPEPELLRCVREIYSEISANDVASLMERVTDDMEYHNAPTAAEAGVRKGREEFRAALGNIEAALAIDRIVIRRWAIHRDDILVAIRTEGTGHASGAPIDQLFVHHFRFERDKVCKFEWFTDWDAAAEIVGLDPDTWETSEQGDQ